VAGPYRGEIAPRGVVELAEDEAPPARSLRVRCWSDGTTRVWIGSARPLWEQVGTWAFAAFLGAASFHDLGDCGAGLQAMYLLGALWCARRGLHASIGERMMVTPAALLRRRWLRRTRVFPLADVSTVLVEGAGKEARLELQIGRERMPVADWLGYELPTLRWIAQRLRRAIEAAR
jgi:hypothetical protein